MDHFIDEIEGVNLGSCPGGIFPELGVRSTPSFIRPSSAKKANLQRFPCVDQPQYLAVPCPISFNFCNCVGVALAKLLPTQTLL